MTARYAPARFLRRLAAVPETPMRVALWSELFETLDPRHALPVVEAVLDANDLHQPAGQMGFLALTQCLQRDARARTALLTAATIGGSARALALLPDDPPARAAEAGELRPPLLHTEREVTLGERRAWARRPDRGMIARLLIDPDPGVVRNLLRNPRVVEADVVRIASRRPVNAAVLEEIFHHPRWGRRRPVQAALVQNPYTPVEIANGLVDLVDLGLLRRLAKEPSIHPVVRGRARARIGDTG